MLNKGFKRSIFWNEHKSKIETLALDNNNLQIILLDSSFQGVIGLLALAYTNDEDNKIERDSDRRYTLPRLDLIKFNMLIDGRNFYDQPTRDKIKRYDELRKIISGKGDDFTTGCLLDYDYYSKHYLVTACDLSKQKMLDADPRSIQ